MTRYTALKFHIVPTLGVWEGDELVDEQVAEAAVVYGLSGLRRFEQQAHIDLEHLNKESAVADQREERHPRRVADGS